MQIISRKDSIIKSLTEQTNSLKTSNEIQATALNANANIFTGLSTFFTLISILVSIIVIAIPILNYFLVIKPNRKALKKLEKLEIEIPKKIETDFGSYLEGFEKRKAKLLIQSLNDPIKRSQATNFFFLSNFSDFDDEDQTNVVNFLEKDIELDDADRMVLNSILISRESLISESFYKRVIEKESKNNQEYAIKYFIENNAERYIRFWEIIIKSSENGHKILMDIFNKIKVPYLGTPFDVKTSEQKLHGQTLVELFFNNSNICEAVRDKELSRNYTNAINVNIVNWHPFIKETTYFKTYFGPSGKRNNTA